MDERNKEKPYTPGMRQRRRFSSLLPYELRNILKKIRKDLQRGVHPRLAMNRRGIEDSEWLLGRLLEGKW